MLCRYLDQLFVVARQRQTTTSTSHRHTVSLLHSTLVVFMLCRYLDQLFVDAKQRQTTTSTSHRHAVFLLLSTLCDFRVVQVPGSTVCGCQAAADDGQHNNRLQQR